MTRRAYLMFAPVGLVLAFGVAYGFANWPGYTDAYYYFNSGARIVNGDGMTDSYLWTYIGAPDSLPAPSHLYWMPMASWLAAAGMMVFNAPGSYDAAQFPFALMLALAGFTAFWLGGRVGGTARHAWAAGLIVLVGGFYSRYWGMVTTFTPFAAFGVGCLVALGRGLDSRRWGGYAVAGLLAGGAHLTRADGVLLVLAGIAAAGWLWLLRALRLRDALLLGVALLTGYLLVMAPWMVRNLQVIGEPLASGGVQGIWFTEYNDIFNYPPDATPQRFWASGGWQLLWDSRRVALVNGVATLVAVEGMVLLTPLMFIGLWHLRREPLLTPFWIYALGLHLAMTLVFPFPGYRGGLFHSSAALFPVWVVLAIVGLDAAVTWIAKRRRNWHPQRAKRTLTAGVVLAALVLSVYIGRSGRSVRVTPPHLEQLMAAVPENARVMVNDPASLYFFTGRGGVVLPNESPEVILEIAAHYDVDYVLLESVWDGVTHAAPLPLVNVPSNPPGFLIPVPLEVSDVRLYRIETAE